MVVNPHPQATDPSPRDEAAVSTVIKQINKIEEQLGAIQKAVTETDSEFEQTRWEELAEAYESIVTDADKLIRDIRGLERKCRENNSGQTEMCESLRGAWKQLSIARGSLITRPSEFQHKYKKLDDIDREPEMTAHAKFVTAREHLGDVVESYAES